MGIFSKIKKRCPEPSPGVVVDAERSYQSLKRFKGTKRLIVTTYGDIEKGMENAVQLLGDDDRVDCTSSEITLTSFRHGSGSGIKISVDGVHIGVVWDSYYDDGRDPVYAAAYSGKIDGVFVRIEREPDTEPRARVYLFVKLPE